MGDITRRITRKSLKAKRKAAIKTIKAQAKEKIHQIKVDYSMDAEKKKEKAAEREHKRELRAQKANARLSYNAHQLPYGDVLYVGIQVVHRGAFHELSPLVALVEHRMKLWQVYVVRGHVRSVVAWHEQHHCSVMDVLYTEYIGI